MPKVFNRDVRLTGGASLYVGDVEVINSSGAITADIQATAGSIGSAEIADGAITATKSSTDMKARSFQTRINGVASTVTKIALIAPVNLSISGFSLASSVGTSGSDGSNNYTFQLHNITQTLDLLATAVTTNSNEITANSEFGGAANQNQNVSSGDVLQVVITKTGTPTDLSSADIVFQVVGNVIN